MGVIDGDLVPSQSGTSHLGIDARGATNFDISTLAPFGHIHQLSGIFHNEVGTSGIVRFGVSSLEVSTDGGKTFSLVPNVTGNTGDVFFNNGGTLGTDSLGLTYKPDINALGVSGELQLLTNSLDITQQSPRVGSGISEFMAINLAERPMFGASNSGMIYPYFFQPSLFNRFIWMAIPSITTTIDVYGNTVTTVGTVSHTAPNAASGFMISIATGGSATNTGGTGCTSAIFNRSSFSGVNTGFFFATRMTLPDTTYDRLRIFVGLTTGTLAGVVGSDGPAGDHCGFQFSTNRGDSGWKFMTRNNSANVLQDTGISCSGNRIWDMYIYSPPFPNNDVIYWTLNDISWNRVSNGYAINNLPRKDQFMRAGLQINNITATVRNINFTHIYCESI